MHELVFANGGAPRSVMLSSVKPSGVISAVAQCGLGLLPVKTTETGA